MAEFPELLQGLMTSLGLSQAAMAERLNVSQPFTSQMLAGKKGPRPDRLVEWANEFKLTGATRRDFIRAGLLTQCPADALDEAAVASELREQAPVATGELDRLAPGMVEATARIISLQRQLDAVGSVESDLFLPVSGRAAAADGAHVDGETDQPDPVRIRSRWRVHVVSGDSGGDVVLPGQSVITDPALAPKRNRLVVIPSDKGPILKRWGEIHGESVVVASISGMDPCLVPLAELGSPEVVVGVLFTDSVAK